MRNSLNTIAWVAVSAALLALVAGGLALLIENDVQPDAGSLLTAYPAERSAGEARLHYFWAGECDGCREADAFLDALGEKYPALVVRRYETWEHPQNTGIEYQFLAAYNIGEARSPLFFLGERYWMGFNDAVAAEIEAAVQSCLEQGCRDLHAERYPTPAQSLTPPLGDGLDCGEVSSALVSEGDTVSSVAAKFGVSPELVRLVNGIEGEALIPGTQVRIVGCPIQYGTPYPEERYTVRTGNTCETIANIYRVSVVSLRVLNGLDDACTLAAGQELIIPWFDPMPGLTPQPGRMTLFEAERAVADYLFATTPSMNPVAVFPLEETTPQDLWEQMGAQMFKVTGEVALWESFLVTRSQVVQLGTAFGGMGVNSTTVRDLNGDGLAELVYTYSFGSGISQSSLGIAYRRGETFFAQDSGYTFRGELSLRPGSQGVELFGQAEGESQPRSLGFVHFESGWPVVEDAGGSTRGVEMPGFSLFFQYPAEWQQTGEARYAGESGFVALSRLENAGSDLRSACTAESNRTGMGYAPFRQLQLVEVDGRTVCRIEGAPGTSGETSAAVFETPGGMAVLAADPVHFPTILGSLRFTWQPPQAQVTPEPITAEVSPGQPQPVLRIEQFGALTFEEYTFVSADIDTPIHLSFVERIPPAVMEKRAAWRERSFAEHADESSRVLEPYGYSLLVRAEGGRDVADLLRGGEVVMAGLTGFLPPSSYLDEQGRGDFAFVVQDSSNQKWLARSESLEPWDEAAHYYAPPVFGSSGRLLELETGPGWNYSMAFIKQDGDTIFEYSFVPSPTSQSVKGLRGWRGGWALEIGGTLFVNGANWNQKEMEADEIFGFHQINDHEFFFFRRGEQVSLWYDGQELPVRYDAVIHDRCCEPAAFNPRFTPNMVAFYGKRGGVCHYVEVGWYE